MCYNRSILILVRGGHMLILIRHKDSRGNTIKYTVYDDDGVKKIFDAITVQRLSSYVTNATLCSSGEFKAKPGNSIETVVDYSNLVVETPKNSRSGIGKNNNLSLNKKKVERKRATNKNTSLIVNKKIDEKPVLRTNIPDDYYGRNYIKVCRKIRDKAIRGELVVNTNIHKSNDGRNVDLFKLIKLCGVSVKGFIKGYLSVLQPYQLEPFEAKKNIASSSLYVCDMGYKYYLVIKIDYMDSNKPVVISFHESNKNGVGNLGCKKYDDKVCAVFYNRKKLKDVGNGYNVSYLVQRGFIRHEILSNTWFINKDVAYVSFKDISEKFDSTMDILFKKLQNVYYSDSETDYVNCSIKSNEVSFMSNGFATVNNISLLLDIYPKVSNNKLSVRVLVQIVTNLLDEMPDGMLVELRSALEVKFKGVYLEGDNGLYDLIMGY